MSDVADRELVEALRAIGTDLCDEAAHELEQKSLKLVSTQERVEALEERLELTVYAIEDGRRVEAGSIDIGDCDGIACRDATIEVQDERIQRLQSRLDASTALLDRAQELLNDGAENTDDPGIHLAVDTVAAAVWLRDMAALVVQRTETDVRCGNHRCDALLSAGEPHVEGCLGGDNDARAAVGLAPAVERQGPGPIPMILHCPCCSYQHVDAPEPETGWTNPPHKSHLCHECRTIWRPASVPTVGVAMLPHAGSSDTWTPDSTFDEGSKARRDLFVARLQTCENALESIREWADGYRYNTDHFEGDTGKVFAWANEALAQLDCEREDRAEEGRGRDHGPDCVPPDEVGDRGSCCCGGDPATIAAQWAEHEKRARDSEDQWDRQMREDAESGALERALSGRGRCTHEWRPFKFGAKCAKCGLLAEEPDEDVNANQPT